MCTASDEASDMGHINQESGADLFGNGGHAGEIEEARIG